MNITTQIHILNKLKIFNEARYLNYKITNRNPERLKFYAQFIKPNDLCFDIGTNIGQKADIFLKLKARVVAVEPQTECIAFLQRKYKNNKNIVFVHRAVDSQPGEKTLYVCEANALSSLSEEWITKEKKTSWTGKETVPTTTLDSLIKEFGAPKFCKIDVEGLELNVLTGLSKRVEYIAFEFTQENFDGCMQGLKHLESIGRFKANFSPAEQASFLFPEWVDAKNFPDALKQIPVSERVGDIYVWMT